MCADSAVKNNLAIAMAVLIVGGGCLGWVGNKAVDYTFSDVRENTEFRIAKEVEDRHTQKELAELKELVVLQGKNSQFNKETLIKILAKLENLKTIDE